MSNKERLNVGNVKKDVVLVIDEILSQTAEGAGDKPIADVVVEGIQDLLGEELIDNSQEKNITDVISYKKNIYGINELLSCEKEALKNHIHEQSDVTEEELLLFGAKLLDIVGVQSAQAIIENNKEVRVILHKVYLTFEDALESNCINRFGDLLSDTEIKVNRLLNAARDAKKAKIKFDPSPYLPNYELFRGKRHGDPFDYLLEHFGEYLAFYNAEGINYLFRGDLVIIDDNLRKALYRMDKSKFEKILPRTGKKSTRQVNSFSQRSVEKFKKINSLSSSHYRR